MSQKEPTSMGDTIEKLTGALKNLVQIVLMVIVAYAIVAVARDESRQVWVRESVKRLGITKIGATEVEFAEQCKEAINAVCAKAEEAAPQQDSNPPAQTVDILSVLPSVDSFWVYLGSMKNGDFVGRPNFRVSKKPTPGETIIAATDTYRRSSKPDESRKDVWRLGKIVGVVKEGDPIKIRKVEAVEGDDGSENLWAEAMLP